MEFLLGLAAAYFCSEEKHKKEEKDITYQWLPGLPKTMSRIF